MFGKKFGQVKKGDIIYGYNMSCGCIIYFYKYQVVGKENPIVTRTQGKFGGKKITKIPIQLKLIEYNLQPYTWFSKEPITAIFNANEDSQFGIINDHMHLFADKRVFNERMRTFQHHMTMNIKRINNICDDEY